MLYPNQGRRWGKKGGEDTIPNLLNASRRSFRHGARGLIGWTGIVLSTDVAGGLDAEVVSEVFVAKGELPLMIPPGRMQVITPAEGLEAAGIFGTGRWEMSREELIPEAGIVDAPLV
jgi:hypothetical protein